MVPMLAKGFLPPCLSLGLECARARTRAHPDHTAAPSACSAEQEHKEF